jgi:hypothetical protein
MGHPMDLHLNVLTQNKSVTWEHFFTKPNKNKEQWENLSGKKLSEYFFSIYLL